MLPGPTLIVKPPGCNTPLKVTTLASGNTFGAVHWTDGKLEAPMLPERPWLMKHPTERVLFWSGDWEQIDAIPFDGDPEQAARWKDLPYAGAPSEQDYFTALVSGVADTEGKLRFVRIRLWWSGNDPIRRSGVGVLTTPHIENLSRLALLLTDEDPPQRLMKAEVFRELGFFEDARKLLEWEFPSELQDSAGFIANLSRAQDDRVARFQ